MTHTVTLLADHKGYTRPRVVGDEYVVDAEINISAYTATTGETITAASLGLTHINAAILTSITGAQPQLSFNIIDGANTRENVFIQVNKEDDTSGISAELADASSDLDGATIKLRVYGMV